jgi:hypothetical protein
MWALEGSSVGLKGGVSLRRGMIAKGEGESKSGWGLRGK